MRKYLYLMYDLGCIAVALVAALYLRHGFPLIQEGKPQDLYLLLVVTFATGATVLVLMKTHLSMWRFTSNSELTNIMIAVGLVVVLCNTTLFLISRLEMMPRSVPPMHWALAVTLMAGSRLLVRRILGPAHPSTKRHLALRQHVLIVGACHTAELYLQFARQVVQHQVVVEGFVDSDVTLMHRTFQNHTIMGTSSDLPRIIEELMVHGIHVKHIILARILDELPEPEREVLLALERSGTVDLVHFAKDMVPQLKPPEQQGSADFYQQVTAFSKSDYKQVGGIYPYVKRAFDVVVGIALLILLLPLIALTSIIVALDVGIPILFWQKRPGLYGKPFYLYKFRTMCASRRRADEDRLAHKSGDGTRSSVVGKMLRRLRLDELPQLIHIIAGTMSFVGPRPLLPDDQPLDGQVRLSVRPGVTGWAQIHGGDALTPDEKLTLDVWYIRHMSFWLDIRILFRTVLVLMNADMRRNYTTDMAHSPRVRGSARV